MSGIVNRQIHLKPYKQANNTTEHHTYDTCTILVIILICNHKHSSQVYLSPKYSIIFHVYSKAER